MQVDERDHAHAVLDRAREHGWMASSWTMRARFVLATSDVLRGRPDEALGHIADAEADSPPYHPHFAAALAVLRGAAEGDTGDPLRGWKRIRNTRLNAGIARDLALSINTVKTHQRGLYQKLGVDNRRQAVIRARQAGFLVPDRNQSPA